jgi:hypothetical protein
MAGRRDSGHKICIFGRKIEAEKIAALAFLLLALAIPQALKPFMDTFANGTSYGKLYAFAAYLVALAFARPFFKVDMRGVAIAIAAVFAFGLFGQAYFLQATTGSTEAKYFAFDSRGYTSTEINHNHALKTALCPFMPSDDYDCARPMLPFLPPFYQYAGLALVIAAAACCVLFYPSLKGGPEKVAFILLSFSSLKSAVDGGILNYESIAFAILLAYFFAKKHRLAWSAAAAAGWFILLCIRYPPYELFELSLPFFVFFYALMVALEKPRVLFPLFLVALLAPLYFFPRSGVITDRWSSDVCVSAGAHRYWQVLTAAIYPSCVFEKQFQCGKVSAFGDIAVYEGVTGVNPRLLLSKTLSEGCGQGVFYITKTKVSPLNASKG